MSFTDIYLWISHSTIEIIKYNLVVNYDLHVKLIASLINRWREIKHLPDFDKAQHLAHFTFSID